MIVSLIAAVARNGAIGKANDLPWRLPDDMRFFMDTTSGHHVVMGRKNYESLPEKFRPLPNRVNLVMTRSPGFSAPGCAVVHELADALAMAKDKGETELFVIGGAEIYTLALPLADRLYLTEIDAEVTGDTFFPALNRQAWQEVSRRHHAADSRHAFAFDFVLYKRDNHDVSE